MTRSPKAAVIIHRCPPDRGPGGDLRRIVAELRPDGMWDLIRERETTGERFVCDDLHDVIDTVLAAYRPDGTPRPFPNEKKEPVQ